MEPIADDDLIARCVTWDKHFAAGVISVEALFFRDTKEESGFLRSLLPADSDVHKEGCKIETGLNTRVSDKRKAKGLPPEPVPGEDRKYYCGFRQAAVRDLALQTERFVVEITRAPEHGQDAHVSMKLIIAENVNKRQAMAEASIQMSRKLGPGFAHICTGNESDEHHPVARFGSACLVGP